MIDSRFVMQLFSVLIDRLFSSEVFCYLQFMIAFHVVIIQYYIKIYMFMSLIKKKSLFLDLHDLQQGGVALDIDRILVDDGELAIHWPLLQLWGQWWSGLGQAGEDNVVMLPGVSLSEAQEFVDILYDREVVNNEHFTVIEDTGVIDEDVLNNNDSVDSVDIKLEPHEIYDQVSCD